MKVRLFKGVSKSGKNYWSISGVNKNKPEDKGTYFFTFGKDCVEPIPQTGTTQSGKEYQYADVDILEAKFGWFNGSPSVYIFKCTQPGQAPQPFKKEETKVEISNDELPFFGG